MQGEFHVYNLDDGTLVNSLNLTSTIEPYEIASDGTNFFVLHEDDSSDHVTAYNSSGTEIWQWTPSGGFGEPGHIEVTNQGIFVFSTGGTICYQLTSWGLEIDSFTFTTLSGTTAMGSDERYLYFTNGTFLLVVDSVSKMPIFYNSSLFVSAIQLVSDSDGLFTVAGGSQTIGSFYRTGKPPRVWLKDVRIVTGKQIKTSCKK